MYYLYTFKQHRSYIMSFSFLEIENQKTDYDNINRLNPKKKKLNESKKEYRIQLSLGKSRITNNWGIHASSIIAPVESKKRLIC